MSILIKGMEMPKSCMRCPLRDNSIQEDPDWCWVLRRNIFPRGDSKEPDCPIIEIPDGHGRLIDADALIPKFVHGHFDDMYVPELEINLAPTIIPADKDGET